MRESKKLMITFFSLLTCCTPNTKDVEKNAFKMPDPRLTDYRTDNAMVQKAIEEARDYLAIREQGVSLSYWYLADTKVNVDTVLLMIKHADYYSELKRLHEAKERESELLKKGDSTFILYVPPNGNWSGRDRTILYLIKEESIVDILDQ